MLGGVCSGREGTAAVVQARLAENTGSAAFLLCFVVVFSPLSASPREDAPTTTAHQTAQQQAVEAAVAAPAPARQVFFYP